MSKERINTKVLSEILADAVLEERFLNKDNLVIKFNALIKSFRLELHSYNYTKQLNEKKEVNLIRTNELNQHEKNFFRRELAKHISEEEMKKVYKNRDLFLQGK